FLVAAAGRRITFGEVAHRGGLVPHQLYFDVSGILHQFLKIDGIVTEGRSSFLASRIPGWFNLFVFPDNAHSPATATCSGFENDRIANVVGYRDAFFYIIYQSV